MKRVIIAGGGTGGHLYPGLAVAEALRHRGVDCQFIGTERGIESKVVPERGFVLNKIRARGLSKQPLQALLALGELGWGILQSLSILRRQRAQLVIGLGGYVCAPALVAAAARGVPAIMLEQNSWPGKANRLLSRLCRYACISFEDTARFLKTRCVVTGNPVREDILRADRDKSLGELCIEPGRKVLVVTGASQGAASINEAVVEALPKWSQNPWTVLHLTGLRHFEQTRQRAEELLPADARLDYRPIGYSDRIAGLYAAADLLICRAGATTLAEITARGLPAILVPYPFAAEGHQEKNARTLVDAGAGIMVRDSEVKPLLADTVAALMEDESRRRQMGAASATLGRPEAVKRILEVIEKVCGPFGQSAEDKVG